MPFITTLIYFNLKLGWGNFSLKLQKIWIPGVFFKSAQVNLILRALCLFMLVLDDIGGKKFIAL